MICGSSIYKKVKLTNFSGSSDFLKGIDTIFNVDPLQNQKNLMLTKNIFPRMFQFGIERIIREFVNFSQIDLSSKFVKI